MTLLKFRGNRWLTGLALTCVCAAAVMSWSGLGRRVFAQADSDAPPAAGAAAPVSAEPRPKTIIGALREQVQQSTILQEAESQQGLLDSLDQAETLYLDAKRRNREALRRLNRSPRVGLRRTARNLVVVIVERLNPERWNATPTDSAVAPLVNSGRSFPNAYAGSADTETAFWSLLQGQNAGRLPRDQSTSRSIDERCSLPHLLWRDGYATAFLGHWPLITQPTDAGFDHAFGISGDDVPEQLYPAALQLNRGEMTVPANRDQAQAVSLWKLLEVETSRWLEAQKQSNAPFLLVVRLPDLSATPPAALSPEVLLAWDHYIGHVTAVLAQQHLAQNTDIVLTALTPEQTSPVGLSEQDLRIPLIVSGPDFEQLASTPTSPVAHWDLLPTCLELAALQRRPADIDGISLLRFRHPAKQSSPAVLYWRSPAQPLDQAVRKENWKGLYFAKDRELQLYNLATDPEERKNVVQDHPAIARELLIGPPEAVDSTLQRRSGS